MSVHLISRLNGPSSHSLFSQEMLQCLSHLCGPFLGSLQFVHDSLALEVQDWAQQSVSHQCCVERTTTPDLLTMLFLMQPGMVLTFQICFKTRSIWHGEEGGQFKTDVHLLCLYKGIITPGDVIILSLAARTSPPNLKLLLISSLIFSAYCIHLQALS